MGERVFFGSQSSWLLVVALIIATLAVVIVQYLRSPADQLTRWLAPAFKSFALLLLAVCILEPLLVGQRARRGANLFLIVADNSQSLTIKDSGAVNTRGELLKQELATEDSSWQVRLGQDFDLRRYIFDSRLQFVPDFTRLSFDGSQSHLVGVLNSLKDRYRARPLAGVLLFTDGIATDDKTGEASFNGLPPIYPVVMGQATRDGLLPDLAVARCTVTSTAFEDAPVTIQADVFQESLPKTKVTAQLIDESGAIVKQEIQSFSGESGPLPFRFQIRPTKPGVSFFEVRVRTEEEAKRSSAESLSGAALSVAAPIVDPNSIESTLANNRRLVAVDRGSSKYRVLYLSGRPNWEYKFLHRAIESDEQVEMTALIRIAKKEPKFDWRSSRGDGASNPLFKGFEGKTEETERYDQPVLIRLDTKTPDELRDGFPKVPEQLYQYHAIVIDDLEANFFTADQLALIERFVTDRGGGLLMLGGAESFRHGGYERTAIGRCLPIYLDKSESSVDPSGYRLSLGRDGWLQPWARLRSTETEEQQRLAEMPNFLTLSRTGLVKPGATVIAEAVDSNGAKLPALAVQRIGRGRCGAMLIGDLWRWQIDRTDAQREKDDLGKAWRQTVRWLIADVPDRIEVRAVERTDLGQPLMKIDVHVRSKQYQPQDNAVVAINLKRPDGSVVSQPAEASLREAGVYESTFAARLPGCYRVTADVHDADGEGLGQAETGWTTDPATEEFARVVPNFELLEKIAKETSGEIVALNDLDSFVRQLPSREAPLTESYTTPLWHQTWVFVLIALSLCLEWALRRWRGLP